ncbi:alpha/beta-hydrolase [Massarina eburnea CBS 473.64]|uniref:Alpha/beta-hydrolase n=1 Tax=Massarina eburnea CBS 473.64 TaxID=1395130 RepID=A0A6A6S957_9PLEO|nr:alpha/beta-hydrolase [Massarina eburnea CBS 473.64]
MLPVSLLKRLARSLLFHGFPDFYYAWRYQIPFLTSLGYRVLAPDMLSYADTDAPCDLSNYALKKMSADMVELIEKVVGKGERVVLGGHDWGAGLAYGFALHFPDSLKAFFTISVPYTVPWLGPSLEWVDLLDLVQNKTYPNFNYQIQWREPAIDRNFTSMEQTRLFLTAGFGGLTADGEPGLTAYDGLYYDRLSQLNPQSLISAEDFEIYVPKIHQNGFHSHFNWYRTRRMNWEDELPIAELGPWKFKTPHLFMPATADSFLPPALYIDMERYFDNVTIEAVEAGHWSMWEKPSDVNNILEKWIGGL